MASIYIRAFLIYSEIMRLRLPFCFAVTLLCSGLAISSPAHADDPDMKELMGALDEASAALDIAWLGTLVDHGQFDAAIAGQNAALASAERLKGEQRAGGIARTNAWVARAHLAKGELDAAADAYRRALQAMESSVATRRELEVDMQVGLGWVALCKGDHGTSLKYFAEAHSTIEKQGRAGTVAELAQLLGTARAHLAAGDRAKAQSALDLAQKFGGAAAEVNVLRVQVLVDLAQNDADRAGKTIRRLNEIENGDQILREMSSTSLERHNLTMLDRLMSDLRLSLSVVAMTNGRDLEARRLALTLLLRRKGLVLEVVATHRAAIRKQAEKDPGLGERVQQLMEIEAELAALERQPPAPAERATYAKRISALVDSSDHRHVAISLHLPPGGGAAEAVKQSNALTIAAVQAALPTDGALIEIVQFKPVRGAATNELTRLGDARYAAFVLKHADEPIFVDLGDAAPTEALIAEFRRSLSEQKDDVKQLARKLDARIMAPLRPSLANVRRLWIAPDRALHTVPFEALVDESDRYLVEQFGMTYLGTGRELVRPRVPVAGGNAPFVLANPLFARGKAPVGARIEATRGVDFRKARFEPLPGTAAEAEGIHKALPNATVVTGEAATRESLLSLVRPSILHIATHGFYLAQDKPQKEGSRGLALEVTHAPADEETATDPLLRSGLALAGADGGAGILSALELASIDLTGTKLAVLSACETGLGDLMNGEGVFGLRRALVIAGTEAQVVSLWQVDDEATRAMMVAYYTKLQAGGGRSEAMRATRLVMMRQPKTAHPFFWASFLVSGEARALDGSDVPFTLEHSNGPPPVAPGSHGCGCETVGLSQPTRTSNLAIWAVFGAIAARLRWRRRQSSGSSCTLKQNHPSACT